MFQPCPGLTHTKEALLKRPPLLAIHISRPAVRRHRTRHQWSSSPGAPSQHRSQPDVSVCGTSYSNANFPTDPKGHTYHLGTKKGEVAHRILSVGSSQRAQLISTLLEPLSPGEPLFQRLSSRGFLTITGLFDGVPVSIVSTHMGMPNMDFVVRENRAVVQGGMAIVRLGTCGAVQRPAKLGDLLIATHGSIAIHRNPDFWTLGLESEAPAAITSLPTSSTASTSSSSNGHGNGNGNGSPGGHVRASGSSFAYADTGLGVEGVKPYRLCLPVPADAELSALLVHEAAAAVGSGRVVQGLNASADSFYSSQGRTGTDFDDLNESLLGEVCAGHPDLVSLEMETFHLLDLARCSRGSIKAVGMCIALAERYSNSFLDYTRLHELEVLGGRAALRALTCMQLEGAPPSVAAAAAAAGAMEAVVQQHHAEGREGQHAVVTVKC